MPTEVGSEAEVKESEKLETNVERENVGDAPECQNEKASETEEGSPTPQIPASQSNPRSSGGKGISRFIPPWLKKQKSYTIEEPKDETKNKQPLTSEEQTAEEGESHPPEEGAQPKGKLEDTTENLQEAKVDEGDKKLYPAKEDSKEIVSEIKEDKQEAEEEKRETKEVQTSEIKIERMLPKLPKRTRTVQCKVMLLDGTEYNCDLEKKAKGQVLFDKVCGHLNLLEKDYFGLLFQDNSDQKNWLDVSKEIKRQIHNLPWMFTFNVKFYPPDPSQLTEDLTRYFLCLQLRQDITSGRLPCSFVTHALLGSYTLQAELGDYDTEEHNSDYIGDFQFAPNQTKEMEEKVVELHKTHRGLTPAQADSQFLENAKRLSMYGVDLHHAKDSEGVDIMLGVCANGLLIYKDRLRINRFAWPKILKISYKRSNFYIKVRPTELEQFESTIGFKLPNHRAAKRLWKVCVEHHTFYRLVSPEQPTKAKFLTLGSKFRYSGRTQAQTRQASNLIDRPAPYFERTSSKRVSRSLDGAPIGITDQSLLKDVSPSVIVSAGDKITEAAGQAKVKVGEGTDVDGGITKMAQLEDGKVETEEEENRKKSYSLTVDGENIYVRHSNLMLEDLDKTQDELLKHQASISELKRNFMESTPEPRPNEWEKRRITPLSLQTQGSLEEEIASILFSTEGFSSSMKSAFTSATLWTTDGTVVKDNIPSEKLSASLSYQLPERLTPQTEELSMGTSKTTKSSHETLSVVEKKQAEVGIEETIVTDDTNRDKMQVVSAGGEIQKMEHQLKKNSSSLSSDSSSSESEDEAGEYRPYQQITQDSIKEELEENEVIKEEEQQKADTILCVNISEEISPAQVTVGHTEVTEGFAQADEVATETNFPKLDKQGLKEERVEEQLKVNGEASHIDIDVSSQIICCSEPPVVKTEMVTISDASQRTEISTKEVPIVQTETKTITYESPQFDGSGDSGVLLSAQTITAESLSTTTTTHITKTIKGGVSETRIEKRIVITGDADLDHDQALAQAIKEAKEQHPDMSVTRVVVHKETELEEEGD
ncbi:band 4.1-like protein 2 isoform X7 [Anolis carolinensis]|uniref:band 4.1-like protein 2 isoform X7 n=1 Tax=Anolis carolinensis TaxID=28377 RepID=UPI0002C8889D|nr:PREDICTED: band 4.1-like protein 2 isoform X1 [Anolis carolinensis]|eukprot:XP_016851896.1 PREDICTED: band 4.1-like protein 2 isoform X1 [Anolis carolinensis]